MVLNAFLANINSMEPTTSQNELSGAATGALPVIREHIVSTPETCGGKPRISGTRIQVKHIVVMHERQGRTAEQIVSEYPHLTLAGVYSALAFYHDHREGSESGHFTLGLDLISVKSMFAGRNVVWAVHPVWHISCCSPC